MLFRKRNKRPPSTDLPESTDRRQFYHIDFEMMLKGSIFKRRRKTVRQFGVTVNGATRLVTSGDTVDRETYDALIAAKAISPPQRLKKNEQSAAHTIKHEAAPHPEE